MGPAGALAIGGLIGPGGIGGTGLLANTGDPNARNAVISRVLVTAGITVQGAGRSGLVIADRVDSALPGGIPLTGRVVQVVENTGRALVRAGNGQDYLIDGVTAAAGSLVNLTLGNAYVVGAQGATPLVGASVLSANQAQGQALTVGVGSGGQALTLAGPGNTGVGGNLVGNVVQTVTGVVSGAGGGQNGGQGSASPVQTVVGTVTGAVQPATGGGANPAQGVVQSVTGLLGGSRPRGTGND